MWSSSTRRPRQPSATRMRSMPLPSKGELRLDKELLLLALENTEVAEHGQHAPRELDAGRFRPSVDLRLLMGGGCQQIEHIVAARPQAAHDGLFATPRMSQSRK